MDGVERGSNLAAAGGSAASAPSSAAVTPPSLLPASPGAAVFASPRAPRAPTSPSATVGASLRAARVVAPTICSKKNPPSLLPASSEAVVFVSPRAPPAPTSPSANVDLAASLRAARVVAATICCKKNLVSILFDVVGGGGANPRESRVGRKIAKRKRRKRNGVQSDEQV